MTITHGLGTTPKYVGVSIVSPASGTTVWNSWQCVSKSSTTATIKCHDQTGVQIGSGVAVTFDWVAYA